MTSYRISFVVFIGMVRTAEGARTRRRVSLVSFAGVITGKKAAASRAARKAEEGEPLSPSMSQDHSQEKVPKLGSGWRAHSSAVCKGNRLSLQLPPSAG